MYSSRKLNRSVEGSVACFIGMWVASLLVFYFENIWQDVNFVNVSAILLSITLFEAYCSDIDNLVLPICGCGLCLFVISVQ